ncbi:hypothetical protein ACOZB2_25580 [Pantoea endophytica]
MNLPNDHIVKSYDEEQQRLVAEIVRWAAWPRSRSVVPLPPTATTTPTPHWNCARTTPAWTRSTPRCSASC